MPLQKQFSGFMLVADCKYYVGDLWADTYNQVLMILLTVYLKPPFPTTYTIMPFLFYLTIEG